MPRWEANAAGLNFPDDWRDILGEAICLAFVPATARSRTASGLGLPSTTPLAVAAFKASRVRSEIRATLFLDEQ